MKSLFFTLLFVLTCISSNQAQNIEMIDELTGVEFLGPSFYTTELKGDLQTVETSVEKCSYLFFKGVVESNLYSQADMISFYEGFIAATVAKNPESIIVEQKLTAIGEFQAMQTELLFLAKDGNTVITHLILVVDDVYYSFQETSLENDLCSNSYNFDVMRESIVVKNIAWKNQYTDKTSLFETAVAGIALGLGAIVGIVLGIIALIRWIF